MTRRPSFHRRAHRSRVAALLAVAVVASLAFACAKPAAEVEPTPVVDRDAPAASRAASSDSADEGSRGERPSGGATHYPPREPSADESGEPLAPVAPTPRRSTPARWEALAPAKLERVVFRDTELQDALRILAEKGNLNVVFNAEQLKGKRVTVELKNVTAEAAINAILRVHGLAAMKSSGGALRVE